MGRPLNKRFLGNPAKPGAQVMVTSAFIPGAVGPATGFFIEKQIGTGRYKVSNGTDHGRVRLVDGSAPLSEGEAVINVSVFGGSTEHAKVIHNRSVKTWEGGSYHWSSEHSASEAGQADLPSEV